jgi:hypothetical protein
LTKKWSVFLTALDAHFVGNDVSSAIKQNLNVYNVASIAVPARGTNEPFVSKTKDQL